MGLQEINSQILSYAQIQEQQQQLKEEGINQAIKLIKKYINYTSKDMDLNYGLLNDSSYNQDDFDENMIYWGDEIETNIIQFDDLEQVVRVQPNLENLDIQVEKINENLEFEVQKEHAKWMIETVPKQPYISKNQYDAIIKNVRERTRMINSILGKNEYIMNLPLFPQTGHKNSYVQINSKQEKDSLLNQNPRVQAIVESIDFRIQQPRELRAPIYRDNMVQNDKLTKKDTDFIRMKSSEEGAIGCSIQVTFSAKNFKHARWAYDQLSIFTPLLLSLTAGSPIVKGHLQKYEVRWDLYNQISDDRNQEERDPNSEQYIPKSRFSSTSLFLSDDERNLDSYNDLNFPLNQEIMEYTKKICKEQKLELDEKFIQHLGFLFKRDLLFLLQEKDFSIFESLICTNWNSMRLKAPPSMDSNIGWRVEFRPCEVQLLDDENSAMAILVHMLFRLVSDENLGLNFYIPVSLLDENFKRAQKINSLVDEKFYFRVNIFDNGLPEIQELSLQQIFFGAEQYGYTGIYNLFLTLQQQQEESQVEANINEGFKQSQKVFEFVKNRCSGQQKSLATWQREFVKNHKLYKQDSYVCDKIIYDMCKQLIGISNGEIIDNNFQFLFEELI